MQRIYLMLLLFLFSTCSTNLPFNETLFNEQMRTANWMGNYKFHSSRALRKYYLASNDTPGNGSVFYYSFNEEDKWKVVIGEYEGATHKNIKHYTFDEYGQAISDTTQRYVNYSFLQALLLAKESVKKKAISFNSELQYYVDYNTDKSIKVWTLPNIVYKSPDWDGGGYYFEFDSTGKDFLMREEYVKLKGMKLNDQKLSIDCTDENFPSMPAIFLASFYRDVVPEIVIISKDYISTRADHKNIWKHQKRK